MSVQIEPPKSGDSLLNGVEKFVFMAKFVQFVRTNPLNYVRIHLVLSLLCLSGLV
jgi:hypothetical protein